MQLIRFEVARCVRPVTSKPCTEPDPLGHLGGRLPSPLRLTIVELLLSRLLSHCPLRLGSTAVSTYGVAPGETRKGPEVMLWKVEQIREEPQWNKKAGIGVSTL